MSGQTISCQGNGPPRQTVIGAGGWRPGTRRLMSISGTWACSAPAAWRMKRWGSASDKVILPPNWYTLMMNAYLTWLTGEGGKQLVPCWSGRLSPLHMKRGQSVSLSPLVPTNNETESKNKRAQRKDKRTPVQEERVENNEVSGLVTPLSLVIIRAEWSARQGDEINNRMRDEQMRPGEEQGDTESRGSVATRSAWWMRVSRRGTGCGILFVSSAADTIWAL